MCREFMTKPESCKGKTLVGTIPLELQGAWAHWPLKVKKRIFCTRPGNVILLRNELYRETPKSTAVSYTRREA